MTRNLVLLPNQEKQMENAGTSKKKNVADTDDDGNSSDSSNEEESPRALSYRTPLLTQVCMLRKP